MIYVPADMLPEGGVRPVPERPKPFVGQSLVIAEVTGIGSSNLRALGGAMGVPETAQIWGQTFHEATFRTLRDSGLFADVVRTGTGRYVLGANILEQTTHGYGATFNVHYVLHDQQTDRDVWAEDVIASYTFPGTAGAVLTPYNTEYKALMRACGRNLATLLEDLAAQPNNRWRGP
jgi:hypothetical protein